MMSRMSATAGLLAAAVLGGCAADQDDVSSPRQTTDDPAATQQDGTDQAVCRQVSELERTVDELAEASLDTWDDRLGAVQDQWDVALDAISTPYPEDVEVFQARLEDVANVVTQSSPDPIAAPLALEDTASELGVAGDLLASSLGCDFS